MPTTEKTFRGRHERGLIKRTKHGDNFRLDNDGDLVMIAPLTKHARQRAKERGISDKDAVNRYAVRVSNGANAVIATVYKNNQNHRVPAVTPTDLPAGHIKEVVQIPKDWAGHIIGAKGRKILKLKTDYQVECVVTDSTPISTKKCVYIWGPNENVQQALLKVHGTMVVLQEEDQKRIARTTRNQPPDPTTLAAGHCIESLRVSVDAAGLVLGKSRRKLLMSIQSSCGVNCVVSDGPNNIEIIVWGEAAAVAKAVEALRKRKRNILKNNFGNVADGPAATDRHKESKHQKGKHATKKAATGAGTDDRSVFAKGNTNKKKQKESLKKGNRKR